MFVFCHEIINTSQELYIKNKMEFGIEVDDGSNLLSELVIEENNKTVQLYDWQKRGLKYFFQHDRAIFECPTGVGKTFFAIHIMKEILKKNPKATFLIVVPKNVILETTWYSEFYNNGINIKDIGVFYGFAKEYCQFTITNMQSLDKVNMDIFDCLVLDECFAGETKIKINKNNELTIKEIVDNKIKCFVPSYNIKTKKIENKEIINWFKIKDKREVIDIIFEDNTKLTVTPEQLIYNGKEYIKACDLKINDEIVSIDKNEKN